MSFETDYLDAKDSYRDNPLLKKAGVDRVSVSIDSMNPDEHDQFRGKKGSWHKAIRALEYVKNAHDSLIIFCQLRF